MSRIFIIVVLIAIVGSLFSALWVLFKKQGPKERVAQALTLRISLSIGLFLLLWLALWLGWIAPQGAR